MINRKKTCLVIAADRHACGRERVTKPYTDMQKYNSDKIQFDILDEEGGKVEFVKLLMYDAVLLQRPTVTQIPLVIAELQKNGIKVVVEIDDRLDFVARDNVASSVFYNNSDANKTFFECMMMADAVHTTTPEIAQAYKLKNKNKNIKVFYNAIDFSDPVYKQEPLRNQYPAGQINVLWAGSTSHWDSIKYIKGVIEHPIMAHERAHLIICGNEQFFDIFDLPPEKKTYIRGVEDVNAFPVMPSHGHISLAPVVQSAFNDGKSELKCLESGVWKSPIIASPVAPYQRFQGQGGGIMLCKGNKPISWQKNLNKLLSNPDEITRLGQEAYENIVANYDQNIINQQRYEWWLEFMGIEQ